MNIQPAQLLIAGMHRSGTSVVARLLNLAGCYLGEADDLMVAMPDNPEGYWERQDVCDVNTEALRLAGVDWNTALGHEVAALHPGQRKSVVHEIRNRIKDLDQHQPWAIKDPRLSITLPLWLPLLTSPVIILCHRHPLEVARSLKSRDGIPLGVGVALWEVYTLAALANSLGIPRLIVQHERLMADPVATVSELQGRLEELGCSGLSKLTKKTVNATVKKGLHRSHLEPDEEHGLFTPARARLHGSVVEGHELEAWTLDLLSPSSREDIVTFQELELLRDSATNDHPEDDGYRKLESELGASKHQQRSLHDRLAQVGQLLEESNQERSGLAGENKQLHGERADLGARLEIAGIELERLRKRVLDLDVISSEAEQVRFQLDQAHIDIKRLGGLVESTNQRKDELSAQVQELHSSRAEMGARLEASARENATSEKESQLRADQFSEQLARAHETTEKENQHREDQLREQLVQAHETTDKLGHLLEDSSSVRDRLGQELQQSHASKGELGSRVEQLSKELEQARLEVGTLQDGEQERLAAAARLEEAHAGLERLTEHLDAVNAQRTQLGAEIQTVHVAKAELGSRVDQLSTELAEARTSIDLLSNAKSKLDQLRGELSEAHMKLENLGQQLDMTSAERQNLGDQLQEVHSQKADLGGRLEQMKSELERLRSVDQESHGLRGQLEQTHSELERVGKQLELLSAERRQLADELQAIHLAKAELGRHLDDATAARDVKIRSMEELERKLKDQEQLLHRLEEATKEREELRDNLRRATDRLRAVNAELNQIRARDEAFEGRASVRFYRSIQRLFGITTAS